MKSEYVLNKIREENPIIDFLSKEGHSPVNESGEYKMYKCPLPGHDDSTASFCVYDRIGEHQNFYCFGCLREDELIWTSEGLCPIKDIKAGDLVFDKNASLSKVKYVVHKRKKLIQIKTGSSSDGLHLTGDHTCFYISKEKALKYLPYITERTGENGKIRFSSRLKNTERSKKYKNKLSLETACADNLKTGDFFLTPIIPIENRFVNIPFKNEHNRFGPKRKNINIKYTDDFAWLIGIWLAEGSFVQDRGIRFSLSYNELHLVKRIKNILKQELCLESSIYKRKEKNICEIVCCNCNLANYFKENFGKGSRKKRIPFNVLQWPVSLQRSLISGYIDGDGTSSGYSSASASEKLSYGIFNLAIQCGMNPYIFKTDSKICREQLHNEFWTIVYRKRESLKCFREFVNGIEYYISIITDKIDDKKDEKVVDISVENTESFVTKHCLTHNCSRSGDIVYLTSLIKNINWKEAYKLLGGEIDVTDKEEIKYILNKIQNSDNNKIKQDLEKEMSEMCFMISVIGYEHMVSTNYDIEEQEFLDTLYEKVDKMISEHNIIDLKDIYNMLFSGDGLGIDSSVWEYRKNKYDIRMEKIYREINS